MSSRPQGKVCVITGTAGSIGRASALAFAREGALAVGRDPSVDGVQATVALLCAGGIEGGMKVRRVPS